MSTEIFYYLYYIFCVKGELFLAKGRSSDFLFLSPPSTRPSISTQSIFRKQGQIRPVQSQGNPNLYRRPHFLFSGTSPLNYEIL